MAKRVQLPDGNIGEFPDGMSTEQIEGVLQKQFPKPIGYQGEMTSTGIAAPQGTASVGGGVKAFAGDIKAMLTPSAPNPYPGMGVEEKTRMAEESGQRTRERKAAGYSKLYRTVAPAAEGIGVNVTGMEKSAREGDPSGVIGHALAVPAALATAKVTGEGLSQVGEFRRALAPKEIAIGTEKVPLLAGEASPETMAGRVQSAVKRSGAGAQKFTDFSQAQQAKIKQVIRNVARETSGMIGPVAEEPGKAMADAASATFEKARPMYRELDKSLVTIPDSMANVSKITEQAIARARKLGVEITPGSGESIIIDGRKFSPSTDPVAWENMKKQGMIPDTAGQPITSYMKVRSELGKMMRSATDAAQKYAIGQEIRAMDAHMDTALRDTPLHDSWTEATRIWTKGYAIRDVADAIRESTQGTPAAEQAPGLSKIPTKTKGAQLVSRLNDLKQEGVLEKAFSPEEIRNLRQSADILDRASGTAGYEFQPGYGVHSTIWRNLIKMPALPLVRAMTTPAGLKAIRVGDYGALATMIGANQTQVNNRKDALDLLNRPATQ